jgi:hypothetical protein
MRTNFLPYLQLTWVGAAVGVGTAAVGFFKEEKAKSAAKKLQGTRPTLSDSPYIKDQLSLAESQLSTGMSAEAKATYEQDMDRSLSTSLQSVLKGGGNPNNVGEIFASDQQGRQRLALMKDNLRLADIDRVTRAQDAAEDLRQKQFGINDDAPWKDQSQAVAASRQGAENMMWSGIGTATSGVMKGIEGINAAKSLNTEAKMPTSHQPLSPSNPNNVPLASTAGGYSDPASQVSTINPNAAPSLLDSLLANNPM